MDRDTISNLYRGPSIDVSYQVSVHLGVSEEKIKMWKVNGRRHKLTLKNLKWNILKFENSLPNKKSYA
jgi:hypothetical protein